MPRLSDAQIEQARSIDLLSYLQTHDPGSVRKSGGSEYCLRDHDSFKMSNGKWRWWSRELGGRSALDYLVKVKGMDFVDAVLSLTGSTAPLYQRKTLPRMNSPPKQENPPKPFKLPRANINNDRVYAYLRGRGIGRDIIKRCFDTGILYESTAHRCVFVGKDGDIPRSAYERGTSDDWKRDVSGSDKRFGISLPPENSEGNSEYSLAVFESPIDLLGHHEIHRIGATGWDGYRLSLGGVNSPALTGFLERHPGITNIQLCLDNDKAGKEAARRIIKALLSDKRYAGVKITVAPPPIGTYSDHSDNSYPRGQGQKRCFCSQDEREVY